MALHKYGNAGDAESSMLKMRWIQVSAAGVALQKLTALFDISTASLKADVLRHLISSHLRCFKLDLDTLWREVRVYRGGRVEAERGGYFHITYTRYICTRAVSVMAEDAAKKSREEPRF